MEEPPCAKLQKLGDDDEVSSDLPFQNADMDYVGNATRQRGVKRRCVAMLMSYYGKGFFGMQVTRNAECPGIEDVFAKCLVDTCLIRSEDYDNFGNVHFQRGCRTDKNVSAVRQVISFKMAELENAVELLNNCLPKNIRVHQFIKVTKGFDSKKWASSRIYNYVLPSVCFESCKLFTPDVMTSFRSNDSLISRVNEVLGHYIGTKNFHNFTSRKEGKDPSAYRYIKSFKVTDTFLWPPANEDDNKTCDVDKQQVEFLNLSVHGQSFMLHQIRKMVGLTMAVVRSNTGEDIFGKIFTKDKYDIPKAPSRGLYLENVFFEYYNKKFGQDGMHSPIEWTQSEEAVEKFKKDFIISNILNDIIHDRVFEEYLPILDLHTYTTEIGHKLDVHKILAARNEQSQDEQEAVEVTNEASVEEELAKNDVEKVSHVNIEHDKNNVGSEN